MRSAIAADDLGRRYHKRWGLRHCTFAIPEGRVVGLVGANGAGKTTLLHLAVGLLEPTEGAVTVLGEPPGDDARRLADVGFVAQHAPVYGSLTVAEHLRLGHRLNATWDQRLAAERIRRLGLPPDQRAGGLSGGQRAQLALTLAIGKRPELLVLDEPAASLDPLARREFLQELMGIVAEDQPTVLLSSHSLADIERVCDHLVVVHEGGVRLEGPVEELLATHKLLTGARRTVDRLPRGQQVVHAAHTPRQTTVLVRTGEPVLDPHWTVSDVALEELVLAYMSTTATSGSPRPIRVAT